MTAQNTSTAIRKPRVYRFNRPLICVLIAVGACAIATNARAEAIGPDVNLKAFGELPVWFNGKVTNWDAVARSYLKQAGGRDIWFDDEGHEQPAIRWLLEVATDPAAAKKRKIYLIEDPELLATFKLTARTKPAGQASRYSFEELIPGYGGFLDRCQKLYFLNPIHYKPGDPAFLMLSYRVMAADHLQVYFSVRDDAGQSPAAGMIGAIGNDAYDAPAAIPPIDRNGRWETIALARTRAQINRIAGGQPRTNLDILNTLLTALDAYRIGDAKTFDAGVEFCSEAFQQSGVIPTPETAPLYFDVPKDWAEGVANWGDGNFYDGNVGADGKVLARFSVGAHPRNMTVSLIELALPIADPARIVNAWRMNASLAPLPLDRAGGLMTRFRAAGRIGKRIELRTPPGAAQAAAKIVAILLWDEKRAWEIYLSGVPELVDQQLPAFEAFVQSLRFSPTLIPQAGFDPRICEDKPRPEDRVLAAVLIDGPRIWTVRMTRVFDDVEASKKIFATFIESLRPAPAEAGAVPVLKWLVPEGFKEQSSFTYGYFVAEDKQVQISIRVDLYIADQDADLEPVLSPLVNVWRAEAGAEQMDHAQILRLVRHLKAGDRDVAILELPERSPDAPFAETPAPLFELPKPKFFLPLGWREEPPMTFQRVRIVAGFDNTSARVSVGAFAGLQPLVANVNRWRDQIHLEEQTEDDILKSAEWITIDGVTGIRVDMTNRENPPWRTIAVQLPRDGQTWYFRMTGPADQVRRQLEHYKTFLDHFKFPEK